MTPAEVKTAISESKKVYWQNEAYEVKLNKDGEMFVQCWNGSISYTEQTDGMYVK
jgi:hypothetical protein